MTAPQHGDSFEPHDRRQAQDESDPALSESELQGESPDRSHASNPLHFGSAPDAPTDSRDSSSATTESVCSDTEDASHHSSPPQPLTLPSIAAPPTAGTFSPPTPRVLRVVPLGSISYLRSYYYIFDSDQWMVSVMAGGLCVLVSQFLPFVPYLVFGGYLLLVIESLVETPEAPYPEFSFDRLTDYMGRAIWPFLVALPFLLVFFLVYLGSYFAGVFGVIMLANSQDPETVGFSLSIGLPLYFFTILAFVAVCWIVLMAMMLRAGLTGSFTEAFRLRWVFDFIRRNWVEQFLVFSFFTLTSMMMSVLGLAFFCVGTFATSAISLMALAHLMAQLYRLHVHRGGELIQPAGRIRPLAGSPKPEA